jgi:tape measure domain-containing protein
MAESIGTVELGIRVDDDQANRDLQQFGRNAQKAGGDAANAFKDLDRRLGLSTTAVSSLSAALGTLAVGEFLRQSVQSAIELETVTRKLSNTLGEQGAAGALTFTRGLADELGLSFRTLSQTFSSFTAAATAANVPIEVQRDLFSAVSTAAQQLGLSNDELSGSLLALQQVASKGTVQMEELRGQLGERLPVAFSAAAKGLGLTQQELIKLVETGQLTADRFFPALAKGLNELTASADGIPTAAQNIAKFQNALDDLKITIGQDILPLVQPFIEALTGVAQGIKIVADASKLGFSRGLTTLLGNIPDQGVDAVVALREVQEQFNLTDKQARALFTDAAKQAGGTVSAFGELRLSAEQFEAVLAKLPGLAQQFRDKYPDRQSQLQAENAQAAALLTQQTKSIASIDNLNAKLKAQRDELNKLEIGSTRFEQLRQAIRSTELQLGAATAAAKGTGAALGELQRISTAGFDFRQQDLSVSQSRLQLAQQVAQAEQDLANQRLTLEGALLSAQEQRALKGVQDESTRQSIVEAFQRRREDLEARQFALREAAAKVEQQRQIESVRLETQLTELAARRGVIQAQISLAQATRSGDPNQIQAAQEGLQLANRELQIAQQISREKLQSQERINQLRLQQLELEKKAAQADNLPPLPQPLRAGNGILQFEFDPTPVDRNSQAVGQAAEQIGASNQGLVEQVRLNTVAIDALANKDWTVQVQVDNQAGGGTTINSYSELQ